jgi:hypothetical protein
MIRQVLKSSRYLTEDSMHSQKNSPACFLRWSVSKVADSLYAVAATVDGKDYDFVGNFKSVREAQQAGRRYAEDLVHNSMAGGRLSLKQEPLAA